MLRKLGRAFSKIFSQITVQMGGGGTTKEKVWIMHTARQSTRALVLAPKLPVCKVISEMITQVALPSFCKEAPIYFSNIFISFWGLAYFTPLGCPLRLKKFWAVSGHNQAPWCLQPAKEV